MNKYPQGMGMAVIYLLMVLFCGYCLHQITEMEKEMVDKCRESNYEYNYCNQELSATKEEE